MPEWTPVSFCPACGKRSYLSRKAAKQAAKVAHPYDHLSAYQCRSEAPERPTPAPWHYGHLAEEICDGIVSRDEKFGNHLSTETVMKLMICQYKNTESSLHCSLGPAHKGPHLAQTASGDWINISQ